MITLTETASEQIKTLLGKETHSEAVGIRVGVRGGGCSGFTYRLDFEKSPTDSDRLIESHGIKLFIDPKSFLYLMGTEIDFVDSLNGAGFKFVNPNAKRTCGCGESFSV